MARRSFIMFVVVPSVSVFVLTILSAEAFTLLCPFGCTFRPEGRLTNTGETDTEAYVAFCKVLVSKVTAI